MAEQAGGAVASPSTTSAPPISFVPVYFPFSRYRTLTFSAGFLCGQASLIFIAVLFLRYVVFEDPKVAMREAGKRKKKRLRNASSKRQRRASSSTRKALFSAAATVPQSDALILEKLSYDLSTHASESADWLNVLIAQAVVAYRGMIVASGGEGGRGAKGYVEDALNQARGVRENDQGIVTLDYITVTEFDFGQEYPVCSNARVRPSNESGKVRIEVDVDYSDHVSLGIETKVLINFPKPKFAIVPVSLALALVRFSATLILEIPPPSSTSSLSSSPAMPKASLSISLYPDFILELASTSLIGSRAKLQDIPKVEQLIIGRIRAWVNNNLVWPKVKTVKLPSLGNSASVNATTREGDAGYIFLDGKERSTENGAVASPDMGSAIDDDEEDDEDVDADEFRTGMKTRIPGQNQPKGRASQLFSKPTEITVEAFTSAFEQDPPPSHALLHERRRSSMASSSAGASSTADTANSPPELNYPTSTEQFHQAYREALSQHRTPLHSPGLGLSYASSANISRNTSSTALNRSSNASRASHRQGKQAGIFDTADPRWEKARRAAKERKSLSPLQDHFSLDEP